MVKKQEVTVTQLASCFMTSSLGDQLSWIDAQGLARLAIEMLTGVKLPPPTIIKVPIMPPNQGD